MAWERIDRAYNRWSRVLLIDRRILTFFCARFQCWRCVIGGTISWCSIIRIQSDSYAVGQTTSPPNSPPDFPCASTFEPFETLSVCPRSPTFPACRHQSLRSGQVFPSLTSGTPPACSGHRLIVAPVSTAFPQPSALCTDTAENGQTPR